MLRRAPGELRRRLERTEHVVAWAESEQGVVAATNLGLWWPDGDQLRRIGWERVDKAIWSEGLLTVTEADVLDDLLLVERSPVSIQLERPGSLPAAVRKRVESTVAHRHEAVVDGRSVWVVARRVPGRDGLTWWARLPADVPDDEDVRGYLRAVIGRLRGGAELF